MRVRIILALSLAVSVLLAWMLVELSRLTGREAGDSPSYFRQVYVPGEKLVRTNVVVRRQFFHWRQLESEDYPTYIANLRSIGCPENTIRDIIVSEVDELFERRRSTEVVTPDQEWWRIEPSMDTLESARRKQAELTRERAELLARLLGHGWEGIGKTSPAADGFNRLDGPVLGKLSDEIKASLRKVESDSKSRTEDYLKARQEKGLPALTSDLARLRQQTRVDLSHLLSPEQLEEYLLRYSSHAQQMRKELRSFEATQEEFRAIFRATDSYDVELATLADATDAASVKRRADLENARNESVGKALGQERLALYQLAQDPLFRQAQAQVEQSGGDADKVLPVFEINRATEAEITRLKADSSLDAEALETAMIKVQREQLKSIQKVLGTGQAP